jgi:hypothetical protein
MGYPRKSLKYFRKEEPVEGKYNKNSERRGKENET